MEPFSWTCPYCGHATTVTSPNYADGNEQLHTSRSKYGEVVGLSWAGIACPNEACRELTLWVSFDSGTRNTHGYYYKMETIQHWPLLPASVAKPQPDYVPEAIRNDYYEACATLRLSPKASATLSRRCLQGLVRDYWEIPHSKRGNLGAEISSIKDRVEPDTWDAIEAIRSVGDIGAHMEKDVNYVVDVEPDEARLLIELIEMMFADWYVARHKRQERHRRVQDLSQRKLEEKRDAKALSKAATAQQPSDPSD